MCQYSITGIYTNSARRSCFLRLDHDPPTIITASPPEVVAHSTPSPHWKRLLAHWAPEMASFLDTTKMPSPPHPFYPIEANIVGYLANKWSVVTLLGMFAFGWAVILRTTLVLVRRHNPALPATEKASILWFVLSKCHRFCQRVLLANGLGY